MATLYAYSPNGTQATLSYSVIGFTQSLQQNGWCKLPNGLILQWGKGSTKISFSISFSNIEFVFVQRAYWNSQPAHADYTMDTENLAKRTKSSVYCYRWTEPGCFWIAIGN